MWQARRLDQHADLARTQIWQAPRQMWQARRFDKNADLTRTQIWQARRFNQHADLARTQMWSLAQIWAARQRFSSVGARAKSALGPNMRLNHICGRATSWWGGHSEDSRSSFDKAGRQSNLLPSLQCCDMRNQAPSLRKILCTPT